VGFKRIHLVMESAFYLPDVSQSVRLSAVCRYQHGYNWADWR